MKRPIAPLLGILLSGVLAGQAADFTPLVPVPGAQLAGSAQAYPGGSFEPGNAVDGRVATEYASASQGTNTYIEVRFERPTRLGAFRHVDRNDPATVAAAELTFKDAEGRVTQTLSIAHANARSGETLFVFPTPIEAQSVRWRVTKLGSNYSTVGAAELAFFGVAEKESRTVRDEVEVRPLPFLQRDGNQTLRITIQHPYAEWADASLRIGDLNPIPWKLAPGRNQKEIQVAAVEAKTTVPVSIEVDGETVVQTELSREPVRPLTVYLLPHSHTDIGYTEIQTDIEKKQVQNLVDGIAHARRTASYPEGARFVWNVEVLWAADLYLKRLGAEQRAAFFEAVEKGQVALCGMYLNELTALCRPEELVRLFRFATKLAERTGKPIDSVMISDVPGYTWGLVPAMSHAGIKYFSTAPNYFDRIGTILREWENKPFWWVGPDGKSKVLVWIPFWGYAVSHRYGSMSTKLVEDFYEGLRKREYPYEIAYARWAGHGDNAVPDPSICDFVRDWNARYEWPRFIISGASEAFAAFEKRYGDSLPTVRGDWTPYWEDGAGSSARETALNRHSSDRLTQAESLFAMLNPKGYQPAAFEEAWNKVLLYSEHTWGADCSISQPESQKTREQWAIKQGYALAADRLSRELLGQAVGTSAGQNGGDSRTFVLFNTTSWPRTELAFAPIELSAVGDRVVDDQGNPVPSQRLVTGQLAFLAKDVAPFSKRVYRVEHGEAFHEARATADGAVLKNDFVQVRLDEKTGAIVELTAKGLSGNLVDTSGGEGLNDYLYLPGDDLKNLQRNGPVTIRVGESGPLVASLIVESEAPGCVKLQREIRIVAGLDYVEMINLVDKARLRAASYHAKEGKESVNFAFPFLIPNGQILVDLPLGMMRPEADQMPSACKNWFTVGRWMDVANIDRGVTWVTLDAPLVEIGGITANLLNSQTNPDVWRKTVEPTQKWYSWAMNNHWGTNYRAYQDGPTVFRYVVRPHRGSEPAEASRFSIGFSQPLVTRPAGKGEEPRAPLLSIEPADVLVTAFKPSDDGRARILRLFNASSESKQVRLRWSEAPKSVRLTDTSEKPGEPVRDEALSVGARELVSLRVE